MRWPKTGEAARAAGASAGGNRIAALGAIPEAAALIQLPRTAAVAAIIAEVAAIAGAAAIIVPITAATTEASTSHRTRTGTIPAILTRRRSAVIMTAGATGGFTPDAT